MTSSSNKLASTMAELMAKHSKDLQPLKKDQVVTGIVTSLKPDILLRVDNKTDVMVMEKDTRLLKQLRGHIKEGQSVEATVLYPESDSGYPVVTLRPFLQKAMWQELEQLKKSGEKFSVTVVEITKGGLVVEMDNGTSGFLPNSHMSGKTGEDMVGKKIQVSIADIQNPSQKIVFSQKQSLTPEDFQKLAKMYPAGTKVTGKISGITTFGIFVSLPYEETTVDGLVHVSEISWEKVDDLSTLFEKGETVEAVVIDMDPRSKRIDLSIKRLSNDPFKKILDAFPADKKVTGIAGDMTEGGLVVDLGEVDGTAVEGLIKKDKIPPTTTYEKGQKVQATVVSVDSRKRKVMLTPVLLEKPLMYR